jgi:hypothetical protein
MKTILFFLIFLPLRASDVGLVVSFGQPEVCMNEAWSKEWSIHLANLTSKVVLLHEVAIARSGMLIDTVLTATGSGEATGRGWGISHGESHWHPVPTTRLAPMTAVVFATQLIIPAPKLIGPGLYKLTVTATARRANGARINITSSPVLLKVNQCERRPGA